MQKTRGRRKEEKEEEEEKKTERTTISLASQTSYM